MNTSNMTLFLLISNMQGWTNDLHKSVEIEIYPIQYLNRLREKIREAEKIMELCLLLSISWQIYISVERTHMNDDSSTQQQQQQQQ